MASMAASTNKPLTVKEAAEESGLHKNTIYALVKRGVIPAVDISPRSHKRRNHRPTWRIRRDDVERFLAGEKARR